MWILPPDQKKQQRCPAAATVYFVGLGFQKKVARRCQRKKQKKEEEIKGSLHSKKKKTETKSQAPVKKEGKLGWEIKGLRTDRLGSRPTKKKKERNFGKRKKSMSDAKRNVCAARESNPGRKNGNLA